MLWRAVIFSTMLHETVANHRVKPNVTVVKALRPRHQLQTPTSALYPECYNEAAYFDIQLPSFNVFVYGNRISEWDVVLEGNYSRKDWTDAFSVNRWWQRSDWVVVRQLGSFHAMKAPPVMCDPDLWPLCKWICVYRNRLEKRKSIAKNKLDLLKLVLGTLFTHRLRFGPMIVFASIAELRPLSEWFHSGRGSWDRGAKLRTVTSFLLSLFRDLILQELLENGKETSLFLLDWEECGTALMVFAGLARPAARLSFFLLKQECRLVNWLVLIRPVHVLITARPQRSWTEIALLW